jgi:hypothetical protein
MDGLPKIYVTKMGVIIKGVYYILDKLYKLKFLS